jgi:hypothetical protein
MEASEALWCPEPEIYDGLIVLYIELAAEAAT